MFLALANVGPAPAASPSGSTPDFLAVGNGFASRFLAHHVGTAVAKSYNATFPNVTQSLAEFTAATGLDQSAYLATNIEATWHGFIQIMLGLTIELAGSYGGYKLLQYLYDIPYAASEFPVHPGNRYDLANGVGNDASFSAIHLFQLMCLSHAILLAIAGDQPLSMLSPARIGEILYTKISTTLADAWTLGKLPQELLPATISLVVGFAAAWFGFFIAGLKIASLYFALTPEYLHNNYLFVMILFTVGIGITWPLRVLYFMGVEKLYEQFFNPTTALTTCTTCQDIYTVGDDLSYILLGVIPNVYGLLSKKFLAPTKMKTA